MYPLDRFTSHCQGSSGKIQEKVRIGMNEEAAFFDETEFHENILEALSTDWNILDEIEIERLITVIGVD
jgi:hypothetical protein